MHSPSYIHISFMKFILLPHTKNLYINSYFRKFKISLPQFRLFSNGNANSSTWRLGFSPFLPSPSLLLDLSEHLLAPSAWRGLGLVGLLHDVLDSPVLVHNGVGGILTSVRALYDYNGLLTGIVLESGQGLTGQDLTRVTDHGCVVVTLCTRHRYIGLSLFQLLLLKYIKLH